MNRLYLTLQFQLHFFGKFSFVRIENSDQCDNFDLSSASTFRPSTCPVLKVLSIAFPLLILISEAVVCFFYVEWILINYLWFNIQFLIGKSNKPIRVRKESDRLKIYFKHTCTCAKIAFSLSQSDRFCICLIKEHVPSGKRYMFCGGAFSVLYFNIKEIFCQVLFKKIF